MGGIPFKTIRLTDHDHSREGGPLKTPVAELRRNIALSDVGAAFLAFQITALEDRCAEMRRRIGQKGCCARPRSKLGGQPSPKKRGFTSGRVKVAKNQDRTLLLV